jgi:hypothetical protein
MQFQSLNSPRHDAHSIPWDSVVLPLGTPGGACARGSQRVPVSRFGLRGHPRLFHNLDSVLVRSSLQVFWEKRRRVSVFLPQHGTALTLRGNFSMKVGASQIEAASARSYGVGQRMGFNYRLHMGRYNSPVGDVQRHGHESTTSKHHQVGRHGLFSGHDSGVFVAPLNAQNAETKHQSGAVPNPTTSPIGFNN